MNYVLFTPSRALGRIMIPSSRMMDSNTICGWSPLTGEMAWSPPAETSQDPGPTVPLPGGERWYEPPPGSFHPGGEPWVFLAAPRSVGCGLPARPLLVLVFAPPSFRGRGGPWALGPVRSVGGEGADTEIEQNRSMEEERRTPPPPLP